MLRRLLPLLGLLALTCLRAPALPFDDASPDFRQSLNGTWRFAYVAKDDARIATFAASDFDDADFGEIAVPGCWETLGWAEPRYVAPDTDHVGLYRLSTVVPAAWQDRQVLLHFGGVAYSYTLFVNGTEVGSHFSAFQPAWFDVTAHATPGQPLLLALVVRADHFALGFDLNDDWSFSGIFRDVDLFSLPPFHLAEHRVTTTVDPAAQRATVTLDVATRAFGSSRVPPGQHSDLELTLRDPAGAIVHRSTTPLTWRGLGGFPSTQVAFTLDNARFWTAETPALYDLELRLVTPDAPPHTVHERVGLREISIDGDVLKLNGQRIKIRGVCRHDEHPDVGRATREEHWREDIALIKAAGFNSVRTSHYPPHPRFLELCDEAGLYVFDEVPAGFHDSHLFDPKVAGTLLPRAEATVARDANRPSVIAWGIGNENPLTTELAKAARYVRLLDPTRPTYYPGDNFSGSADPRSTGRDASGQLYSKHYPQLPALTAWAAANPTGLPMVFTEINHALDVANGAFADRWALVEAHDHLAGGHVWLWADQSVRRSIDGRPVHDSYTSIHGLGPSDLSGDVYLDDNTLLDSNGAQGTDGIVYGDRQPQTDYFDVKAVIAPVAVRETALPVTPGAHLSITVLNRFDFLDLADLTARWTLLEADRPVASGALDLTGAPHTATPVTLPAPPAPADPTQPRFLQLTFADPAGRELRDHRIALIEPHPAAPAATVPLHHPAPDTWQFGDLHATLAADGKLRLARADGTPLVTTWSIRVGRQPTMSERRTYEQDGLAIWEPRQLDRWTVDETATTPDSATVSFTATADGSERAVRATLTYTFGTDGTVAVDYTLTPVQSDGALLEFGLSCDLAGPVDYVRWHGHGPYPAYPHKEALAQPGVWQVPFADPFFAGNRRAVREATVAPVGLTFFADAADLTWEPTRDGGHAWRRAPLSNDLRLTHLARIAALGTKFAAPLQRLPAADLAPVTGHFTLRP